MNYNDELSKARAELAAVQERLAKLEAEQNKQAVATKPWEPKGGEYFLTSGGKVGLGCNMEDYRLAGAYYPTREAAESALPYVTFFKRLCCLAAELNPSGKVGGVYRVLTVGNYMWEASDIVDSRDPIDLFETKEVAQKAADILNRDSWAVPAL